MQWFRLLTAHLSHGATDDWQLQAGGDGSRQPDSQENVCLQNYPQDRTQNCKENNEDPSCNKQQRVLRPALPLLLLPLAALFLGLLFGESLSLELGDLGTLGGAWLIKNTATLFKGVCETFFNDSSVSLAIRTTTAIVLSLTAMSALLAILFVRKRQPLITILTLSALLAGLAVGLRYWSDIVDNSALLATADHVGASVKIISDPRIGSFSSTQIAEIQSRDGSQGVVQIRWQSNQEPLAQGMQFIADFSFSAIRAKDTYLFEQGICGTVTVSNYTQPIFRKDLIGSIDSFRTKNVEHIQSIGGDGAALLCGVLLGNTESLRNTDTEQAFRATGLSHLIAVSGSHLVVIASLLGWVLSKLPGRRSIEIVLIIVVLVFYVILTGMQPSAIRAAVMSGVASCSFFVKRRAHTPSALCTAAIAMLLIYPPNTFSIGFWLSVFAVFGITLFCPLVQSWIAVLTDTVWVRVKERVKARVIQRIKGGIKERRRRLRANIRGKFPISALALTCTAQTATLPIAIPVFSVLPLISPVANLIVTPLITVMVGGGMLSLCAGELFPNVAHVMLLALCRLGDVASWLAALLAAVPFAAIPLFMKQIPAIAGALIVAGLLYYFWPRPTVQRALKLLVTIVLAVSVTCVVIPRFNQPQLIMLDVGQGDALVVREGNHAILVDTGPSGTALIQALARQHITHLDAVVITHLDFDHCGALGSMRGIISVDRVFFAVGLMEAQAHHEAVTAARALVGEDNMYSLKLYDVIKLSSHIQLEVVWPDRPVAGTANADSICLMMTFDNEGDGVPEHKVLLTGDAENPQLVSMLNAGLIESCDIIKIGHHGSRASITLEQITVLKVQIALISVGANNYYGHPTQETLAALLANDVTVLRTDINGDVIVSFNALALYIQCATMEGGS